MIIVIQILLSLVFTTFVTLLLDHLFVPDKDALFFIPLIILFIVSVPFVLSLIKYTVKHKVQPLYLKSWSRLFVLAHWQGEILAFLVTVVMYWLITYVFQINNRLELFFLLLCISQFIAYKSMNYQIKIYLKITKHL